MSDELGFEGDTWMFAYSRKTKGQNSASFFYLLSLDKFIAFILLLGQSVTCKLGFDLTRVQGLREIACAARGQRKQSPIFSAIPVYQHHRIIGVQFNQSNT